MLFSAINDIIAAFREFTDQAIVFALAAVAFYASISILIFVVRLIKRKAPHSIWYVLFKTCLFALFGIYMSYLVALTLSGRNPAERGEVLNIDPLSTIIRNGHIPVTVFENFLLFVPLGVLIPMTWKYFRGFIRTVIMGFSISVLIEVTQLITGRGYFDVDDIILNVLGTIFGYALFSGIYDGFMGVKRRVLVDVARKCHMAPPLGKLYERFILRNGFILFVVQLVPVLVWYNVIMGFSHNNGDESGYLSKKILSKLINILRGGVKVTNADIAGSDTLLQYEKVLRKMAHMFEYGVLAILVWALIYSIRWVAKVMSYGFAIFVAAMVGVLDETNQATMIGRTGTYKDVIVDSIGATIALIIVGVVVLISKRHYLKKHQR